MADPTQVKAVFEKYIKGDLSNEQASLANASTQTANAKMFRHAADRVTAAMNEVMALISTPTAP